MYGSDEQTWRHGFRLFVPPLQMKYGSVPFTKNEQPMTEISATVGTLCESNVLAARTMPYVEPPDGAKTDEPVSYWQVEPEQPAPQNWQKASPVPSWDGQVAPL